MVTTEHAPQPIAALSADSHISETEDCFREIDPKFEERRPRAIYDEKRGAILEISDLGIKVPMGIICTAGRSPEQFSEPSPGFLRSPFRK